MAIRTPAAAHSGELRLRQIRKASRIRPNCCQVARFLCGENGLPHQCAHWLAMTCRRQRRVSGCKNVGRNDMQKAETCLRVQGRFGSTPAVPRYCADRRQVSACHCEERGSRPATWQSVLLAAVHNEEQYFGRIRKGLRICPKWCQLARLFCGGERIATPVCALARNDMLKTDRRQRVQGRLPTVIARSEATWQSVLLRQGMAKSSA